MSTIAKLSGEDFDRMVQLGAFVDLEPLKVELIYGELRFKNPAGPVHEGEIQFLMERSFFNTNHEAISVPVQCSINCGGTAQNRISCGRVDALRASSPDASGCFLLVIEVADSSLEQDLGEKAKLYAEHGIPEYWVVDVPSEQVHVHRTPVNGRYQTIQPFAKNLLHQPRLPTGRNAIVG